MKTFEIAHVNPDYVDPWEIFSFRFLDFGAKPTVKGYHVDSPAFTSGGCNWKIRLYPFGRDTTLAGWTSIFLHNESQQDIIVDFEFIARDKKGKAFRSYKTFNRHFSKKCSTNEDYHNDIHGDDMFDTYNDIFEGIGSRRTLTIELRMKTKGGQRRQNFIPKNAFSSDTTKLLFNNDNADVSFQIKGKGGLSDTLIHAHRLVLKACAPTLASLCENCDKTNPAPISDADPTIFKLLICYMYGGSIPSSRWERRSKEILELADKYGIITLKIVAEVRYVEHFQFTVENVINTLLYADGRNYALLKEAAIMFIAENATELIASDLFEKVPKTKNIIQEIFAVIGRNRHGVSKSNHNVSTMYKSMSVNDLRRNLYMKGMDIDGSREMLIARLENQPSTKKRKSSA